jgi:hypothetical protein
MLELTNDFKNKVRAALLKVRENYDGADSAFAKQWGINGSVYNRIKSGEVDGLIKDVQWLNIGRELGVTMHDRNFSIAKTDVYKAIEEEVDFCQKHSKAMIFVDDCEIGKTVAAKHLSRNRKNCFYIDASQAKTKHLFTRLLAKTIGLDPSGKYAEVKENIKYYLKMLPSPMVIVDDAGDLHSDVFVDLKEFWNATENICGWYLIGDDSLQRMIEKSINSKKVGFRAFFSRWSSNYSRVTPIEKQDKMFFYRKLITDVLSVNMDDKANLEIIVKRCLTQGSAGQIGGLRRAESLLILNS